MSDVQVVIEIARPPQVVRDWWLGFSDLYENPKEQPHKIVTRSRTDTTIDTLTYWRGPMGREIVVPELFTLRADGWDVDATLPLGLHQHDHFVLTPTPTGTRVTIDVDIRARSGLGRLTRAGWVRYGQKNYPRMWQAAKKWCEKATPGAGSGAASPSGGPGAEPPALS